jgi:peroxiredoxin
MRPISRRQACLLVFIGGAASLVAACQPGAAPTAAPKPTTAPNPLIKPRGSGAELTALQASSELALGRNRFAMGLIDAQNQPITTGTARVEFFKVQQGGTAEKRSDAPAVFRTVGEPTRGIWVANTSFDEVGSWGAQVTLQRPGDASPKVARLSFDVQQKFSAPGYGDPAPRSKTPTAADVGGDVARICSNSPPCELHQVSVAGALEAADKPLVVVFATPALCTSQLCAPELDAIVQLHGTYADRANFVHVEIYEYPFDGQHEAGAVGEWNLPSEPWTFVVDRGGVVRDRFEGAAPTEELEPALQAVLT